MVDTEDFFTTSEMMARLDLVHHLIENSELVPLVRGPAGIGKSVMASRLQQLAPDNWVVCHFTADSMMQPERLLSYIARCNGLPDAPGECLALLEERYALLRKRGSTPVLLVDDAQMLPPTSLITLLRLYERQVEGSPLVSLVLFANEQIDILLSTPQLQVMTPQAIQVIDLPPFTREEANGFMRYLLIAEGLGEQFLLDETKMNRIYRDTSGIPGPMANAILAAVGGDGTPSKAPAWLIKKPLLIFGLPVITLILLMLVFQEEINSLFKPSQDNPPVVMNDPVQIPDQVEPPRVSEKEAVAPLAEAEALEPAYTPIITTAPITGAEPVAMPPLIATATPGPAPDIPMPDESSPPLPTQSKDEESATEETAGVVKSSRSEEQVAKPTEGIPVSSSDSAKIGEKAVPEQPPSVTEGQRPPAEEEAHTSTPAPTVDVVPQTGGAEQVSRVDPLVKSSEWLASQSQGSYTIQLLAVENIESIKPVIARHGIDEKSFVIESRRQGKPWFPLLWGVFPDKPSALAALRQLPPSLTKGGAWVRPLVSLKRR